MIKRAIYIFAPVVLLAACSGNVQNPVDRITFRDEPLIRDVETGMSRSRYWPSVASPRRPQLAL